MRTRRPITLALALAAGAVLNGCAVTPELTYDDARDQTREALQLMVDQLPSETEVDDRSTETPLSCGDGRATYTGHWIASPGAGFNGEQFVAELPSALGEKFTLEEDPIEISLPSVGLDSEGMTFSVTVVEVDGEQLVDLLGISRCGTVPAS